MERMDFSSDEYSVKTLSLEWGMLINPFVNVTTKWQWELLIEKLRKIWTILWFIAKILFAKILSENGFWIKN